MTYSLSEHVRAFFCALQFLTTLPVSLSSAPSERVQGLSLLWYPAVGLLLGALLCLVAGWLPGPAMLAAAIVLTLWVVLTGALHLDGLADCADAGVGGMGDRARTLELLKDPTCGVMAVVAIVLVLLLKWVGLTVLLESGTPAWLLLPPLLARLSVFSLFIYLPYVREAGIGAVTASHFPSGAAKRALLVIVIALLVFLPWRTLFLVAVLVGAIVWWIARTAMRRLGGFTGDVAGAQVELVEVSVLLVLALWAV